jgi:hypothetical protein
MLRLLAQLPVPCVQPGTLGSTSTLWRWSLWSTLRLGVWPCAAAISSGADGVHDMQANRTLAANSWDQYVSAIIEYYNVTSGSTQLSNSTAAPGDLPLLWRWPEQPQRVTCDDVERQETPVSRYPGIVSHCAGAAHPSGGTYAGEASQGGISGFFNDVTNVAKGVINAGENFGNILDTIK